MQNSIDNPQPQLIPSILAGPVLWALQFLLLYGLAEFGCRANSTNFILIQPILQQGIMLGATAAALALLAFAAWQAWRVRGRLPAEHPKESHYDAHTRFMVQTALALALLFGWVMVVTAIPIFVLPICDGAA